MLWGSSTGNQQHDKLQQVVKIKGTPPMNHTNDTELTVQTAVAGGYTSSSNEGDTVVPREEAPGSSHGRPQRNRRPPSRYDDFVPVGNEDDSD